MAELDQRLKYSFITLDKSSTVQTNIMVTGV